MPIIESLLDIDDYKFTMGQLVYLKYRGVPVKYGFKNRTTGVKLANIISKEEIIDEFDHVRSLRFLPDELEYLESQQLSDRNKYNAQYLAFLADYQLPEYSIEATKDGQFKIEFAGFWHKAIYWETIALSIINELYNKALLEDNFRAEIRQQTAYNLGIRKLQEKIDLLRKYPGIKIIEFGTRRRFSRKWQDWVVKKLKEEIPEQLVGTSNVCLAKKHNIPSKGTQAHEMFMVMACLLDQSKNRHGNLRHSTDLVLSDWWQIYGPDLSIALPDTFGSDFFLGHMNRESIENWKGFRQDSGCPYSFSDKVLAFYRRLSLDPKEKMIVYSDGLEVEPIIKLYNTYSDQIQTAFGWGTNLTNDVLFKSLSLVVKIVEAAGKGAVKLSDNLAKAVGKKEDIKRYIQAFGYTEGLHSECKY